MGHGHVTPNAEAAAEKDDTIIAVALPPRTGGTLAEFLYEGALPSKDFIRENGPSSEHSKGETDE